MTTKALELEEIYRSEHHRLEAQISRKLGSSVGARDLVHDIFLRIWEKAEQLTISPAYLSRSARNAAIDHIRVEKTRRNFAITVLPDQFIGSSAATPYEELEARDRACLVEEAIRGLPERTRHVYLLHRVHNRSYKDIGEAIGVSVSAVEKHMAKAILAIRSALT